MGEGFFKLHFLLGLYYIFISFLLWFITYQNVFKAFTWKVLVVVRVALRSGHPGLWVVTAQHENNDEKQHWVSGLFQIKWMSSVHICSHCSNSEEPYRRYFTSDLCAFKSFIMQENVTPTYLQWFHNHKQKQTYYLMFPWVYCPMNKILRSWPVQWAV